ncbi:RGS domain-containing protein [Aspergillus pseudotamarii]|uniref:RGS domain-containing protein n=1 Tax=Aspergillus pseudotamarii TaxID=132259 RepID=A0A5N6SZN2_ASPPS|nr:RGS domain-containing protein [Aspergillus pseudotamarii]KAE8139229.1 RGS domain-containing protein [Aspergillus pseudotamarii]
MKPQSKTLYHLRPKLDEILNDTAPVPYTLGTFIAFLAQNHCLEVLEFILEAKRYRKTYDWLQDHGKKCGEDEAHEERLRRVWDRIIETYIESGAPREINVPNETREELLSYTKTYGSVPPPSLLDSAVQHMHELLRDSILIPYLRSCSGTSHVQPLSVPCLSGTERLSPSPRASDDTARRRSKFNGLIPSSPADMCSSDGSEPPTRCISRETSSQEPPGSSCSDTGRLVTGGQNWHVLPNGEGAEMSHAITAPERKTRSPESPNKKRWRRLQGFAKHFRRSSD